MFKLLVSTIIALGLAAAGFWYWTGTPQYSMMKLAEAVRNHDIDSFKTYFDVDSVSTYAVEDLSQEQIRQIGGTGLLQRFVGMTISGIFKPELSSMLAGNICDYVEQNPTRNSKIKEQKTQKQAEPLAPKPEKPRALLDRAVGGLVNAIVETIKPPSMREVLNELGLSKENFKGLSEFETKGRISHVGLKFQGENKPEIIVQLELENTQDRHWRVLRISNLQSVARAVAGF